MVNIRKHIYVYADWIGLGRAILMGVLSVDVVRGSEVFAFSYEKEWLKNRFSMQLDPDLHLYSGDQYLSENKSNFGVFIDSCPDRWGRVLLKRREAILARKENREHSKLHESDFLLGVYDGNRMGGLRFKLDPLGNFLDDNRLLATPPWSSLRELEVASAKLEEDGVENSKEYLKWLSMLITPGSSLGGARPKASVIDEDNNLWIAKFPSRFDDSNSGAWEMVAYQIAIDAGIKMSESRVGKYNSSGHTFLTKRFDRTHNQRIHFASAMTCLGRVDGQNDVSYLEIAEFIAHNGSQINKDLEQLWRRIVLSICISNVDDHLRNHGFILEKSGWRLSPAYDINPDRDGNGLNLNISEYDNSQDLGLALSVIRQFRIEPAKANKIILQVKKACQKWQKHASKLGISTAKQDLMSRAFRCAY